MKIQIINTHFIYLQESCQSTNCDVLPIDTKLRSHSINYVSSDYEVPNI